MTASSTSRRASALALVASAALSLPATASARPMQDLPAFGPTADQVREPTPGDSPALAISLAGGALALVTAGGGYVALRGRRLRPVPRVHAKV